MISERMSGAIPRVCDVLVLGAGAAGLRAALAAARAGARTVVLSKMPADAPNCTVCAWGGITYAGTGNESEFFRQVVVTGGYLNDQRLVEVLAAETPARVAELAGFGVTMDVLNDADLHNRLGLLKLPGTGESRTAGYGLTRPLRRAAAEAGARFVDDCMASRLVVRDGRAAGVEGFLTTTGEPVAIAAGAVIVATGGGACMFGRTDNPPGTTADGIALAYQAGAELIDIECVSFQVSARVLDAIRSLRAPDASLLTQGNAHYFLGGIAIGADTATRVPGLFAAGEAAGGVFGAGRLGGAALAETIVFGTRAGAAAAAFASRAVPTSLEPCDLTEEAGEAPDALTRELQDVMWRLCGTMKTEQTLHDACSALDRLRHTPVRASASDPQQLQAAQEFRNMVVIAHVICQASLLRCETRGCYWRVDCPQPAAPDALCNIRVRHQSGNDALVKSRPAMTRLQHPTEPRIGAGCFGYLEPAP